VAEPETRTDALIRRLKNHKVLSLIIVGAICIGAVAGFIGQLDNVRKVFWPPRNAAAPSERGPTKVPDVPHEPVRPAPEPQAEAKPQAPHTPAKDERVFVDCQMGLLPSIVPPEGRIHVLVTSEIPVSMGGGGLEDYFGRLDAFTNNGAPATAYRCEFTNYSSDVLFNLTVPVHLTFRMSLPVPGQDKSRSEGDVTLDRDWVVNIPKLDPSPAAPYVFYVWNCCVPKFVHVALPDALVYKGRKIVLVQSTGNLFSSLDPVPFS
jgi:hypothetical protein